MAAEESRINFLQVTSCVNVHDNVPLFPRLLAEADVIPFSISFLPFPRSRLHFYCCVCNSGDSRADFTIVARSFWAHKLCEIERLEEESLKKSRDCAEEGQL